MSAWGFKAVARDSGFGIRDSGFGIRDSGFGIRDSGFGIRDSGFGKECGGPGCGVNTLNPESQLLNPGLSHAVVRCFLD
ncbi:MAG: hypothetical protein WC982_14025, partial [Advenella sp.]